MSVISTTHSIIDYTSGITKALAGQDLINVNFKVIKESTKDNPFNLAVGSKPASKAVSLPKLVDSEITANISALMPAIKDLLDNTREDILRDSVIAGKSQLTDEEINLQALISYLNANKSSGRMNKETLENWFDETASSPLMLAISSRLGITADTLESDSKYKMLNDTLESYKSNFAKFASPKISLTDESIAALEKALTFVSVDSIDKTKDFISNKLVALKEKPKADLFAL